MKIILNGCPYPWGGRGEAITAEQVMRSPEGQYAVAILGGGVIAAAGRVTQETPACLTLDYIDRAEQSDTEVDLFQYRVTWDTLCYGFCKVHVLAIDSGRRSTHRIYVDAELYKRSYEAVTGTPYQGGKKFPEGQV